MSRCTVTFRICLLLSCVARVIGSESCTDSDESVCVSTTFLLQHGMEMHGGLKSTDPLGVIGAIIGDGDVSEDILEERLKGNGTYTGCYYPDGTVVHIHTAGCNCFDSGDPEKLIPIYPSAEAIANFKPEVLANLYPVMEATKAVAWFHCPKCGTTFLNSIYHHPDICPFTPPNVKVPKTDEKCENSIPEFLAKYPFEVFCPGGTSSTYTIKEAGDYHLGLSDDAYNSNKGHLMGFFRQPEQRVISAWNHGKHSWNQDYPANTVKEYALGMQGCYTRMLGSHEVDFCGMSKAPPEGLPSQDILNTALTRVREGFAFIGITERWDESICLFHAMFGGPCNLSEFENPRLGYFRSDDEEPYDTSELEGFVDPYDGAIYAEVTRIFNASLSRYHVDFDLCASVCPEKFGTK